MLPTWLKNLLFGSPEQQVERKAKREQQKQRQKQIDEEAEEAYWTAKKQGKIERRRKQGYQEGLTGKKPTSGLLGNIEKAAQFGEGMTKGIEGWSKSMGLPEWNLTPPSHKKKQKQT